MNPYGASSLIGTAIALPVLSIIAVLLRFFVRLRMKRSYVGIDDWLILLSLILVCGQCVLQILGTLRRCPHFSYRHVCRGAMVVVVPIILKTNAACLL